MKILCQSTIMLFFFLSLSPLFAQVDCDNIPDLGIELEIISPNAPNIFEGDIVCVNFIGTGVINLTLFQLNLGFDPTVLSLSGDPIPGPSLLGVSVSANGTASDQGKIPIIWQQDSAIPTSLQDGEILMTICFRADKAGECSGLFNLTEFTNNPPFATFATADYNESDPTGSGVCGDIEIVFNTQNTEICIGCDRIIVSDVGICNSDGGLTFSSCGGTYPATFDILSLSGGPTISGVVDFEGEIQQYSSLPNGTYIIEMRDADGAAASYTLDIDRSLGEIILATTIVHPRCSNTNDGEIQYAVSGGMADYNLLLSNGVNYQDEIGTIGNLINGSYDITVTDAVGCSAEFPAILIETSPIIIDIEVDSFTCMRASDGEIRAKASGGTPFPGNEYEFNNTITNCWVEEDPMNVSFVFNEADTCFNLELRDSRGCPMDTCIFLPIRNSFQFDFDTIPPSCNDLGYTSTITITSAERYLISLFTDTGNLVQSFGNNTFQENLVGLEPGNYRWQLQETMGDMCIENYEFTIPDFTIEPIELTTTAIPPDCGQANGSASINIVNGVPPYDYSWAFDLTMNNGTLSNIPSGQYDVTITDGRGCEKDTFVDLDFGAALTIEGQINLELDCSFDGMPAQLEVTFTGFLESELTFEWYTDTENNLGNTPILQTDTAGIYIIEVNTLAGDCLITDTLELISPGIITFDVVPINPASCDTQNPIAGSIEILNIAGSGSGSGPFNCRWYLGDLDTPFGPITDITCSRDNLDAGLYLIEIVDNMSGCSTIAEVNLFGDDDITFEPTLTPPTCPGDTDGTIAIGGIVGGPALTCTWSDPGVVAIGCVASNLAAGSYTVNITDENGCEKDTIFVLEDPVIFSAEVTDSTATSCLGGVDGSATVMVTSNPANLTDFTFLWSNGDQDLIGTEAINMGLTPGQNTVSVLDGRCSVVLDFSIPEPSNVTLELTEIMTRCNGSCDASIDLSATGGTAPNNNYSFFWELDGSTSASRDDLCLGAYAVRVSDENGCEFIDSIFVTEPDSLFLEIEVTSLGCNDTGLGGSINIVATGGCGNFTYLWPNAESTTESAIGLETGNYEITVSDDCGCSKTIEGEILGETEIFAEIEISGEATCPGEQVCLGINQNTITGGTGSGYTFTVGSGALGNSIPIDSCIWVLPGPHSVSIFDPESCQLDLGIVDIPGPPEFSVSLGPDISTELGDEQITVSTEIINSTPIVDISWVVNEEWECVDPMFCDEITFAPTTNSLVTVIVTDENGCTAVDDLAVNLSALRRVYYPTAFLPDSDIENRFMLQTGRGVEAIEEFSVYDKWGNKMFELPDVAKDFPHSKDDGWDGRKNNRNVEPGVYVWIANIRFSDGISISYNGQITLIR